MRLFGLIGKPLSHSFSPSFFAEKFARENIADAEYRAFELDEISELPKLVAAHPNLVGLNVTIPYKSEVLRYADFQSEEVREIGAANTLCIRDEKIWAFNTDVYGFETSLKNFLPRKPKNALIFGNGGAAKAVKFVLQKWGVSFEIVERHAKKDNLTYRNLTQNQLAETELLVQTTPVGMYPHSDDKIDLPYEGVTIGHFAYDLIYNPLETKFLQICKSKGAKIHNGLPMLKLQAERSWELWHSEFFKE